MEINAKTPHSAAMPLLPISSNPSNPAVSPSITTRCIEKLVLIHRALLLALGTIALLCVFMSTSIVPQTPKFQLESLFMSKLNAGNTSLGAKWDVVFTIENPNLVSWIRFSHIEGSISYKNNPLATYVFEPIDLGLKEHRIMRVKISTTWLKEGKLMVDEWVLDEIDRQREGGAVNFSMQMFAWATYRTGWWGTQYVILNPQCSDLRVGFLPKVGFGSWINGGPMTCSIGSYES